MPILETRVDRSSESFRTNREQMLALIAEFRGLEQNVRGASWLELATLAGYRMHDDDGRGGIQAGGGIAGVGYVAGIRCVVAASDSAIKGGTSTPMGVKKNLRVQQIARENKLPMLRLVESGGAKMHATISGLGEYLAEDDADGIRIARDVMAKLPWNAQLPARAEKAFKE